jgi:hypothetical protein
LGRVVLLCALCACGGSSKKTQDGGLSTSTNGRDASVKMDAGIDAGVVKKPVKRPDAGVKMDAAVADAGTDAGAVQPFDNDAAGDYIKDPGVGPVPAAWTCLPALWNDGHCDCGCSVADSDCRTGSCIDPGCVSMQCDACFTLSGSWKPCAADPDPNAWTCMPSQMSDGLCDCGCGIPDPDCQGKGCSGAGCRTSACDVRTGCTTAMITAGDDCSSVNPKPLTNGTWTCPWDRYGSGDGCDCGCGVPDPDCATGGCSAARCFDAACSRCSDELGRPYACAAAQAGWDDDIVGGPDTSEPSQCNATHFGTNDGCDCGCGGHDPDCGDNLGCDAAGCSDNACNRCTDPVTLKPVGCAPATWVDDQHKCRAESYGTGDGCDCGCGVPDPDCNGNGCTTPGCTDSACEVCNDATQSPPYVKCPGWTCSDPSAFTNAECDCGCGVVDPYCRQSNLYSCTAAGCETAACDHCNDSGGVRTPCGGQWQSGSGNKCNLKLYGIDGLCDCGCGATDPDCGADQSCTDQGCNAAGCDVCHDGSLISLCDQWTCNEASFGKGDGCDCGCGALDPDCSGAGCKAPGCKDAACTLCHDTFGRVVPCP